MMRSRSSLQILLITFTFFLFWAFFSCVDLINHISMYLFDESPVLEANDNYALEYDIPHWRPGECMRGGQSSFSNLSHPKSPFWQMPSPKNLLSPYSATISICHTDLENLRVMLILSPSWSNKIRNAIRKTYANFTSYKNLKGNWTKMFVVGNNKEARDSLLWENRMFGDVVIVNVPDGYEHHLTLKMLVALKFVSCYCSNADFVIKSDDDNYVHVGLLDAAIVEEQQKIIKESRKWFGFYKQSEERFPDRMYMGARASPNPVRKRNNTRWGVDWKEYSRKLYPPYLNGPLYIMSLELVQDMALICAHTCTGLDPLFVRLHVNESCFWKFEDVFLGSCIHYIGEVETVDTTNVRVRFFQDMERLHREETIPKENVYLTAIKNEKDLYNIHKYLRHQT